MIKTFTGPMHSGKSAAMIEVYREIKDKEHILCFKPFKDTRDYGVIKSKAYEDSIPAICIVKFDDILNYINDNIKTIFIDEIELLEGNMRVLSYLSIMKDIDIYVAGLNMTSEIEPFLIMPYILAISDEVVNIKARCNDCGRENSASYTYFNGEKTDAVLVGDAGYVSLCSECVKKREEKGKKLLFGPSIKK